MRARPRHGAPGAGQGLRGGGGVNVTHHLSCLLEKSLRVSQLFSRVSERVCPGDSEDLSVVIVSERAEAPLTWLKAEGRNSCKFLRGFRDGIIIIGGGGSGGGGESGGREKFTITHSDSHPK